MVIHLKDKGDAYLDRILDEVVRYGEPDRLFPGVATIEEAKYFHRVLPQSRAIGLLNAASDIDGALAAGVRIIRLKPEWLADAGQIARIRAARAEILLAAYEGTDDEVARILPFRPEYIFTNNQSELKRTLGRKCK